MFLQVKIIMQASFQLCNQRYNNIIHYKGNRGLNIHDVHVHPRDGAPSSKHIFLRACNVFTYRP